MLYKNDVQYSPHHHGVGRYPAQDALVSGARASDGVGRGHVDEGRLFHERDLGASW